MKQKRKKVLIVAGVVLAIGLVAAAVVRRTPALVEALGLAEPAPRGIAASGFIEAEEIAIAPEVGGRIAEILVEEGDEVEADQVLVRLDDTLARAQLEVAQAGLEVAQARLALVKAGARIEEIRQAEAALAQAEAARDGAYQAWQDALALLENPQEIDAQIVLAEAQLAQAEAALRQATALRDMAQIAKDAFEQAIESFPPGERRRIRVAHGTVEEVLPDLPPELQQFIADLPEGTYTYGDWEVLISGEEITVYRWVTAFYPLEAHLTPNRYWKATVGYNSAQAAYDGAKRALSLLYAMRSDPQQIQAQVDAAEAEYRAAEAAVERARARLEGLRAGATREEVAAVEAQVQQAEAEVESAMVFLEKLTLTAPASGQVLEVTRQVGELATPGVTLITLADLDQVTLTVYVPENRLGQVQVGQRVEVRVDSFPGRVFLGRVVSIASEAEFTPRNVQTEEGRTNMVFAVKVVIPNPDHALKPGMPADATILTGEP
ncbi:MAG TPA: HlyD family efflux transporter periplasmic adaptor subunit [Thermoflexia bacterium]|jgi:multidrug resistance efflux pump|nr:HlyD family efflux transporter periplasmic adaptor subunit [Thermoflexia bacterium]